MKDFLENNSYIGKFCISQNKKDEIGFTLLYTLRLKKHVQVLLRQTEDKKFIDVSELALQNRSHDEEEDDDDDDNLNENEKNTKKIVVLPDSLYSFILSFNSRNNYILKLPMDSRPFAQIAVADRDNNRIQVLRYHWTSTLCYQPTLQAIFEIGGNRNKIITLFDPVSVSYSSSGELAVCDMKTQSVFVLSEHLDVLKIIKIPFSNPTATISSPKKNILKRQISEKMRNKYFYEDIQKEESKPKIIDKPCSVAFTADGKIIVGFKKGGNYYNWILFVIIGFLIFSYFFS
jgi:hypothetical protein